MTLTLTSISKIMQVKPLGVKLCFLIGHMTTIGVASLCIILPSRGQPEVIQKYLIPIYQVGSQWKSLTGVETAARVLVVQGCNIGCLYRCDKDNRCSRMVIM